MGKMNKKKTSSHSCRAIRERLKKAGFRITKFRCGKRLFKDNGGTVTLTEVKANLWSN
jgi:hypothetical protein